MAVSLLGCSLLKASFIRSHTHHVAIRPSVDGAESHVSDAS